MYIGPGSSTWSQISAPAIPSVQQGIDADGTLDGVTACLVAAATRTHEAQARRHTRRHPDQRDGPPAAASPHARRPPAAATYRRGVRSSSARPQLATTLASAARRRTLRATLLTANSAATPQGTLAAGLPRLAAGRGGFPPAVRSP
jgi:hypothetical protein